MRTYSVPTLILSYQGSRYALRPSCVTFRKRHGGAHSQSVYQNSAVGHSPAVLRMRGGIPERVAPRSRLRSIFPVCTMQTSGCKSPASCLRYGHIPIVKARYIPHFTSKITQRVKWLTKKGTCEDDNSPTIWGHHGQSAYAQLPIYLWLSACWW